MEVRYALRGKAKALHGSTARQLLGGDVDGNTVAKVGNAVNREETDNVVGTSSDSVGLSHIDMTVVSDKVRVHAHLASLGTNTRRGDYVNQNERLVTERGKRIRVGKSVGDGDCTITGGTVNGANVAGWDIELRGVGDGVVVRSDDVVRHGGKPFCCLVGDTIRVVDEGLKRHTVIL